jgi:succinate-semialdehyde dehydrogenase/glutarate-semialdehyde dehydrogenase
MSIASINPATGETLQSFAAHTDTDIESKLTLAARAFAVHRKTAFAERARLLHAVGDALEKDQERFARLAALEMGKTVTSALAEVKKCAATCHHYAENAERYLADQVIASDARKSYVRYLPLGPVLAVMPWNFPFWQVIRFAAPALMAGNVVLLKHASNVPQCALALEALFASAGGAPGTFQTLLIESKDVARVISDHRVVAVTLTGSEAAGASVGEHAGRAIKKCVLELGGSDPFIVMPSADLDEAVSKAVLARNINNGQSCIAAKRFIVHEQVYDAFLKGFVERMERVVVGDPLDPRTEVGPLASKQARDELHALVQRSGAKVLCGGEPRSGPGWFYPPTVLAEISERSPMYHRELFGPVAMVLRAKDIGHAISLANDSPYGLASSVWTTSHEEIERFVNEIEAGQTFVNAMVASDPRLPFGGVKQSGYGRELADLGIKEFCNAKTVYER